MEEVDSQFSEWIPSGEVFGISVSVGLTFQDLDFVVNTFDLACGDAMFEVIQDALQVSDQFVSEPDEQVNAAGPGFGQPVGDKDARLFRVSAPRSGSCVPCGWPPRPRL